MEKVVVVVMVGIGEGDGGNSGGSSGGTVFLLNASQSMQGRMDEPSILPKYL